MSYKFKKLFKLRKIKGVWTLHCVVCNTYEELGGTERAEDHAYKHDRWFHKVIQI